MATTDDRSYLARRAEQEAVLAVQSPPGAACDAHRAMCVSYSRQLVDALRHGAGADAVGGAALGW